MIYKRIFTGLLAGVMMFGSAFSVQAAPGDSDSGVRASAEAGQGGENSQELRGVWMTEISMC